MPSAVTALTYSRMAEIAASLAAYIRALGYPAIPCGNDTLQSIPLAIDAGLGEMGRNGLMLTPEYGPRLRICKVFTDLPLARISPLISVCKHFAKTATLAPILSGESHPDWMSAPPNRLPFRTVPLSAWHVNVEAVICFGGEPIRLLELYRCLSLVFAIIHAIGWS